MGLMEGGGGQMIYPSSEGVPLNSLPAACIDYQPSSIQRKYVDQEAEISMAGNCSSQLCPASAFCMGPYKVV